jgi:mono/diheme cytochrome c family protein
VAVAAAVVSLQAVGPAAASQRVVLAQSPSQSPTQSTNQSTAQSTNQSLTQYCIACHNARAKIGGLSLDGLDAARVGDHPDVWENVVRKLRTGTMPPPGMPRPDQATYDRLASGLETDLDRAGPVHPGRPLLRRMNRAEYASVVKDLLDVQVDVRSLLPPDDAAFGFDNVADLLVVSPALLERYLDAADRVSALAIGDPATAPGAETYHVRGDQSQDQHAGGLPLGTVGGLAVTHTFPLDGVYQLNLTLFRNNLEAIRGLEHPHQVEISVDGERVFLGTVGALTAQAPQAVVAPVADGETEAGQGASITDRSDAVDARLTVRIPVKAGPRVVAAAFIRKTGHGTTRLRPFLRSNSGTYDSTGRPHIETLTIAGPFEAAGPGDTPSRRRIFVCRPAAVSEETPCATRILSTLARRAYRRPVTPADLARLLPFCRPWR